MDDTGKPEGGDVAHIQETPEWTALEKMLGEAGYQLVALPKERIAQVEEFIGGHPEMLGKPMDEKVNCVLEGFIETVKVLNAHINPGKSPPLDQLAG